MDDIRSWIYSLPARFQSTARILTSVDFLKHLLLLKDGSGNYLIEDYDGQILDKRVSLSDGMPDILSGGSLIAGAYAAIVGDFRWYWIVDAADDLLVQRLEELYALENEVGFQIWQETDGMAVIPSAFYALKIKA
jgi:HK97 family phage major capsid protein